MVSPSPVAAAPPTELSAYAPAPTIGESPTRLEEQTFTFTAAQNHTILQIKD